MKNIKLKIKNPFTLLLLTFYYILFNYAKLIPKTTKSILINIFLFNINVQSNYIKIIDKKTIK